MILIRNTSLLSVLLVLWVPACSCSSPSDPDAGTGLDAPSTDGGGNDGGPGADVPGLDANLDAGTVIDTGMLDSGLRDVGAPIDAPRPDAGMCMDLPADPTRPVPVQCSLCRPPGPGGGSGGGGCTSDADCTAGDNGRCLFGRIGAFCDYDTCFSDGDCSNTEVCLCDGASSGTGGGNVCIPAECRVNADCADGFACSPTLGSCGHYTNFVAYRCHRAADECSSDADCGGGYCAFDEAAAHWICSTAECVG